MKRVSDQIVLRLKERGMAAKSERALENIFAACAFLERNGLEITVAAVGNFCRGRTGGPAAQSVRNNKDYHAYVLARRSEQSLRPAHGKSESRKPFRSGDLNIDAHIQTLEYELQKTKTELHSLRQALPRLGEYDLSSAIEEGVLVIAAPQLPSISDEARSAILTLLNPDSLGAAGLILAKTGQIIAPDQNGSVLLNKVQVDALSALVNKPRDTIL